MELLDVYNERHERTGRCCYRNEEIEENERLLVVHCCIIDSEGRMLIQQRQFNKDRYPGAWDLSSGGFAKSGESAAEAALRELNEELGIEARENELKFLFTEPFSFVLDDFFILKKNIRPGELQLQQEELAAVRWAEKDEIIYMIKSGEFVDYDINILERIFENKAEAG